MRNIWGFARDFVSRKYLSYIMSVALCIVVFFLLSIAFFSYSVTIYGRKQCERIFARGVENTGNFIFCGDVGYDSFINMIKDVSMLEEIAAAGTVNITPLTLIENTEFYDIQYKLHPEIFKIGNPANASMAVTFTQSSKNLYDIKLKKGEFKSTETDENGNTYIYLGADYDFIDIGTTYTNDIGTCIVAGILEDDTYIINENILFRESDILELDYSICLDKYIICVWDSDHTNLTTFSVNDGYTLDEGIEAIKNVANKYSGEIMVTTCDGILKTRELKNARITDAVKEIMVSITIIVLLIVICIQISEAIERGGEFGIMYANGCSSRDIGFILVMENVRRVLVAFLIWLVLGFIAVKFMLIPHYSTYVYSVESGIIIDLVVRNVLPFVAVFAIICMLIMSIVPLIITKRLQPARLIGEFKV